MTNDLPDVAFGVTSRNAVDAAIALAERYDRPLMLIASRAQVDAGWIGGGYAGRWTTGDLVRHVRDRDSAGRVLVCRDHGGPWQHPSEVAGGMGEAAAMDSSLRSFREDILAGFAVLHIDTSADRHGPAATESAIRRLVRLYAACQAIAEEHRRPVRFEIGFETQGEEVGEPEAFRAALRDVLGRLADAALPAPAFVVAQTGTKVVETVNRGAVVRAPDAVRDGVRRLARICRDAGVRLKAHNVDYLGDRALRALVDGGVGAVNVAPEFGVTETRALLYLLGELGLTRQRDAFLALAYESGAWRKWLADGSAAGDLDRCVIAGHYVFGTEAFQDIEAEVARACEARGIDLGAHLRAAIQAAMERYLHALHAPTSDREMVGRA